MKVRVPHYYDAFSCTGSECPDTCCVGWMIEIDDESYERFQKIEGEFGKQILNNIIEHDGGRYFALDDKGRCAFLNKDNLCDMVINHGEDSLCNLCDNYPRVGVEFGDLREMGLSFSCPEVAKLILSSKKTCKFGEWLIDEESTETDYTRDITFITLMESRDVAFAILQNREYTIGERIGVYVMFAARIQNVLEDNNPEAISKLNEKFADNSYIEKCIKAIKKSGMDETKKLMEAILTFDSKLISVNEKWLKMLSQVKKFVVDSSVSEFEKLNADFEKIYSDNQYVYEHLMVYYVYRYFMKMIFDGDIYSKAIMHSLSTMVIREINVAEYAVKGDFTMEDQINAMYMYSKEIEHCEENMAALCDEFWDNDLYQTQSIICNVTNIL